MKTPNFCRSWMKTMAIEFPIRFDEIYKYYIYTYKYICIYSINDIYIYFMCIHFIQHTFPWAGIFVYIEYIYIYMYMFHMYILYLTSYYISRDIQYICIYIYIFIRQTCWHRKASADDPVQLQINLDKLRSTETQRRIN